jgi:ketosteroid isomerase-like protein
VAAKADVGYTFGLWRGTREGPDGTTVTNAGSYVSIWRKQPDGSWRCSVEISNLGELPNLGERPAR